MKYPQKLTNRLQIFKKSSYRTNEIKFSIFEHKHANEFVCVCLQTNIKERKRLKTGKYSITVNLKIQISEK